MRDSDSPQPAGETRTYPIAAIDEAISAAGLQPLSAVALTKFGIYLDLLLKWNARTNLTSVRTPDQIVARHFVECIACAQALPNSIESLLDFGSGAGFPGVPIAICRPELSVTLAESQNKKAAFLLELVRQLDLRVSVFPQRAEKLSNKFDCITLRAVDRMDTAIPAAARLLSPQGFLAVMTTHDETESIERETPGFSWQADVLLPGSSRRILLIGRRVGSTQNFMFHVEQ